MIKRIPLSRLHPHPGNPRIASRDDIIEQIAAQLDGEMDEAYALIVRPNGKHYQIISGHTRILAAERAGLKEVPCHIREMTDDEAYMALVLCNAQAELRELEIGLHALRSPKKATEYARETGYNEKTIQNWVASAKVAEKNEGAFAFSSLIDYCTHLREIYHAPEWLWNALVAATIENEWPSRKVNQVVEKVVKATNPPKWTDIEALATDIVAGTAKPAICTQLRKDVDEACKRIEGNEIEPDHYTNRLMKLLERLRPYKRSDVATIINHILSKQEAVLRKKREEQAKAQREREDREERLLRYRSYISLSEWKELTPEEKQDILTFDEGTASPCFNEQTNADIEWAQWSWNPITGCLHDCPYCYARDIALQARMKKVYPHGFEPTLRPQQLRAPMSKLPPPEAKKDARFKNVFTGSMADIFGRWVPDEWIEAVLNQIRAAPKWNFLCLTKFPKRMAEFDIPTNAWMGTTVDLQARVKAAESAFAKVKCDVRWLSIEPMLEPLQFSRLDLFDWIIIGGASGSTKTPPWRPPVEWVFDLVTQARAVGCKIYFKTNLFGGPDKTDGCIQSGARILELPGDLPIEQEQHAILPDAFRYLGRAKTDDQKAETD